MLTEGHSSASRYPFQEQGDVIITDTQLFPSSTGDSSEHSAKKIRRASLLLGVKGGTDFFGFVAFHFFLKITSGSRILLEDCTKKHEFNTELGNSRDTHVRIWVWIQHTLLSSMYARQCRARVPLSTPYQHVSLPSNKGKKT